MASAVDRIHEGERPDEASLPQWRYGSGPSADASAKGYEKRTALSYVRHLSAHASAPNYRACELGTIRSHNRRFKSATPGRQGPKNSISARPRILGQPQTSDIRWSMEPE